MIESSDWRPAGHCYGASRYPLGPARLFGSHITHVPAGVLKRCGGAGGYDYSDYTYGGGTKGEYRGRTVSGRQLRTKPLGLFTVRRLWGQQSRRVALQLHRREASDRVDSAAGTLISLTIPRCAATGCNAPGSRVVYFSKRSAFKGAINLDTSVWLSATTMSAPITSPAAMIIIPAA